MIIFNGKDLLEISKKTNIGLEELISVSEWVPKTIEEAEEACYFLSGRSKLREMFLTLWINLITTTDGAGQLYRKLEGEGAGAGSKIGELLVKWDKISREEYSKIKTVNDAKIACSGSVPESEIQKMIIVKWIELLTTAEESKEAFHCPLIKKTYQEEIVLKWKNFCLEEIRTATDAQKCYFSLPDGWKAKSEILLKWIDISHTTEDLVKACNRAEVGTELRKVAILKIIELS